MVYQTTAFQWAIHMEFSQDASDCGRWFSTRNALMAASS